MAGYSSGVQFQWDLKKADRNLRVHQVSFDEVATVFGDPLARIHADPDHSEGESREIIVGHSRVGRLLLVCFTERNMGLRLLSARKATNHERKQYQQNR